MAAPHVAGAVAVVRTALGAGATPAAILDTLLSSPTNTTVPGSGVTKPRLNLLSIPGASCGSVAALRDVLSINGGARWTTSRSVTCAWGAGGFAECLLGESAVVPC